MVPLPERAGTLGEVGRYDLTPAGLAALLAGEPAYRARQVWDALYLRSAEPAEMAELPGRLRAALQSAPEMAASLELCRQSVADGGATVKWLWSLQDGLAVETVLMHYPARTTVCVSSQAGCAMGCVFCATGQAGFGRHLSTGEIVEQVMRAARCCREAGRRLSHVVLMGMGEPLANYPRVIDAIRRLHHDAGISPRRITVSTVGLVPAIRRLAAEGLPVNLAVSLHAATDELRDRLVPLNRRWPLRELMGACRDYNQRTRRRISFEWALIDQLNDTSEQAVALAGLARPLGAHVNLIPLNPTPGWPAAGTPPAGVARFAAELARLGVNATVRQTRGRAIDAACGQLARHTAGAPVRL